MQQESRYRAKLNFQRIVNFVMQTGCILRLYIAIKKQKQNIMENNSHIIIVLDRSGSTQSIAQSTIEGFNEFIEMQRSSAEPSKISLIQFDDQYQVVYQDINISQAEPLTGRTYVPRGSTALVDAIGTTINNNKTRESNICNYYRW
jgi:hypothetical protein